MSVFKKRNSKFKIDENEVVDDLEMQVNEIDEASTHQKTNEPKSYQDQLLSALFNKDIDHFIFVLSTGNVKPDYYYTDPNDGIQKTCVDMACSEPGNSEYVQSLLTHGANINNYNPFLKKVPLFIATETGDIGTLRVLLSHSKLRVNAAINDQTVLNLALEKLNSIEDSPCKSFEVQKYKKIIEMLTKAKAKVFCDNMRNLILEMGIVNAMVTTRLTQQIQKDMLSLQPCAKRDDLIFLLENNEKAFVNRFREYVKDEDVAKKFSLQEEKYVLLEKACEKGFDQAVNIIIKHQCGGKSTLPEKNVHKNIGDLAAVACRKGNHEILKIFLETNTRFTVKSESLLQITIKAKHQNKDIDESKYKECIKLLLNDERELLNINYLDFLHDTALHHAVRYGDDETAMMLLKKGSSINILNVFDEFPVSKMSSELLHQHLDECVKLEKNNNLFQEDDEEIMFDYRFLIPLIRTRSENFIDKPRKSNISQECFVPETEVLLYMSEQPRLRKLLAHPLITCFLFLKWQRIRYFHWLNTTFFLMFYVSIMSQAILGTQSEHIHWIHDSTQMLLGILTFREIIQFTVSPKTHLFDKENWLEIFLIATSWMAIYGTEDHKRQLLSVAVMLSSIEFFFMVGRYPKWSLYVEILRTVTINFLKFFLWYSLVIIAFALCFYVLFKTDENKKNMTNIVFNISQDDNSTRPFFSIKLQIQKAEDEDPDLFSGPGLAIFKTIVMLTSEYDASSINFDQYPLVSYSIFVIFIFTISIVLMNLLNGLAVSDIQKITAEAQLWSYIYQVQMISYFERCFLGKNRLKLRVPGSLEWVHHEIRAFIGKCFFRRVQHAICRFPGYEPNLLISAKADGCIDITMKKIANKSNRSKITCCSKLRTYFNSRFKKIFKSSTKQNTLNSARAIIDEKLKEVDVQDKIKIKLKVLEENLNNMNKKIETINITSKNLEHALNFTTNKLEALENRSEICEIKLSDTCQHLKELIYKFDSSLNIIKTVKSRRRSLSE